MPITIKGGRISDCGTGVKTEGPVDLEVDGLTIERTKKAYDFSNQPEEPKDDKGAGDGSSKRARLVDKLLFPVSAALITAVILGCFTYMRPLFGF